MESNEQKSGEGTLRHDSPTGSGLLEKAHDSQTATMEEPATESPLPDAKPTDEENKEYISGFKLITVVASVTMVVFLLLLDQSILSTVSPNPQLTALILFPTRRAPMADYGPFVFT
jgi:hypothetical protein